MPARRILRPVILLLVAATLTAQGALPQTQSVLRATTHLVQVNVIVRNRKGAPLKNLSARDFSLLDDNLPQQIAFFAAEHPAPVQPAHPLPANVFTNRFDVKGQDPGTITVILFDALNTPAEDQARVRSHILHFLQALRPQDRVAIYALTGELVILHDFTSDASSLVAAVNHFQPKTSGILDASNPQMLDVPALRGDPGWARFQAAFNNASGEISDAAVGDRFRITADAIEAIAEHVAGIPGRKNLIWVSGGIPNILGFGRIGIPDRDTVSFEGSGYDTATRERASAPEPGSAGTSGDKSAAEAAKAVNAQPKHLDPFIHGFAGVAQTLNRVNMAIYPVDSQGLDVNAQAFFARQSRLDTFRVLADRTGGKAFYGTNDIAGAMRAASEDGRFTYTLGYYPAHGKWDGTFHKIKILVKAPGALVRYRSGYFALPDSVQDEAATKLALRDAAFSPLDATSLGIIVSGRLQGHFADRKLILQIKLDPKQFLLFDSEDRRRGNLDLLFLQADAHGNFVTADHQHFDASFTQREYELLARAGLILQRTIDVAPASSEIRVVVRDSGSGALGSVSLPVEAFLPASASAASPGEKH